MKKIIGIFLAFAVIITVLPLQSKAETIPMLEVKLVNYLGNKSTITVVFNGEYTLSNGKKVSAGTETVMSIVDNELKLSTSNGQVLIENEIMAATPVKTDSTLAINGRNYYGSFQFVLEKDVKSNKLYIRPINKIDIETYLRGVVPQEMPALWSMEALKAQTIAARTYALKHKNDTNMVDTIVKQVYGGVTAIHLRSDIAVKETEGLVLKYNNTLIDALFSASNGGMTELNSSVWGGTAVPYFAVEQDAFDFHPSTKEKFPWYIQLKQQQIPETLDLNAADTWWSSVKEADADQQVLKNIKTWMKNEGYISDVNQIKISTIAKLELDLKTLSSGGRVSKGTVKMDYLFKDDGKAVEKKSLELIGTSASKIRAMVGIDKMPSYLIDVSETKNEIIVIKGRGNGHGVGLSQYGAKNRAEAGHNHKQILQFYYPKASLVKEYSTASSSSPNTSSTAAVKKDTAAPVISSFKASADYKKNTAKLTMKINKAGKTTIIIKDSKGKTVSTLAKNKAVKSGAVSVDWNISKVGNDKYTAEITAANLDGYTKTVKQNVTIAKPAKEKKGSVKANVLNVRQKPSTSSKVITKLKKKQTVVILSQQGTTWYKVKYGSKTGYVSAKYITVLK